MKMKKETKEKIYSIIGKIVVYISIWACGVAFVVWAFLQNTIY